ncbi:MAG: arginase family protein [Alicyclobacillus macrosporangiidus]|uniref:arginase family protein n=1 Tax=Alicyclobacillus macrosporangiidus TaxID=392015 RepID=UPI0026F36275|nr:arginase family protein [Alicyclobacillus macrosporangiidus]MCL6600103.1 arginase family protein [Alicyclobacillus macrosporangiidus]
MYTGDLGVTFLDFDGTLRVQDLQLPIPSEWVDCTDIAGTKGLCDPFAARAIQSRLARRRWRGVTFIGSGNYHYVSYLLLSEIREPFTLVLFDHHTDLAPMPNPPLSCGSWVTLALDRLPQLRRIVIAGCRADAPRPGSEGSGTCPGAPRVRVLDEATVRQGTPRSVAERLDQAAGPWPLYISVDKDVLRPADAATDWDAGSVNLRRLLYWLVWLRRRHRIIGIDICGERPAHPLALLSADAMRQIRKNQAANRAILHALRCG